MAVLSESFQISRGIKQGPALSPSLFLVVMDPLLSGARQSDESLKPDINPHWLAACETEVSPSKI